MRWHRVGHLAMFVLVAVSAAIILLPWKPIVEKQIVRTLATKGISPASVRVDHIGLRGLVLKNVSLGDPPVLLTSLTLAYQWRALLEGRIEDIELNGLALHGIQREGAWQLEGLENLLRSKSPASPAAIPVTKAEMHKLPLSSLKVTDSRLNLVGSGMVAEVPLTLELQHNTTTNITAESAKANIALGENILAIGNLKINLALDDAKQQWVGNWTMDEINVISQSISLPTLKGSGSITLLKEEVKLTGSVVNADQSYKAEFNLNYNLNNPAVSVAVLKRLNMPFSNGRLSAREVRFPLDGKKHGTSFTLQLNNIAVDKLLQSLTNNRATASGIVSGSIPVTLTAKGDVRIGKGSLKAEGPGTIALAPEVIPGDNQQVELVREVMKNLQYQVLALEFGMAPDNNLSAKLSVEGRNPDVENGRPIKLNVNLSGDLLDLIKQNVTLMTDPKTFIENNHAKTN
ncbi:MAG: intermembrane phospholipid transport protein YdbH family protein [Rickettsiales bacterium]